MAGLAFLVVLLVVFFMNSGKNRKGYFADIPRNSFSYPFVLWLFSIIFIIIAFNHFPLLLAPLALVFIPLLFPSFIAYLFCCSARYKAAYYISLIAIFSFMEDRYGGALYSGYKAASKLKNKENKNNALQWLRSRYLRRKHVVFSGEMAMIVIIEAEINKPDDLQYLSDQLALLNGYARNSVPKQIRSLIFKQRVLLALAHQNWEKAVLIAKKFIGNKHADFIVEFYKRYIHPHERPNWGNYFFSWLANSFDRKLIRALKLAKQQKLANLDIRATPLQELWLAELNIREFNFDQIDRQLKSLQTPPLKKRWRLRAEELGIRDDEAWSIIENSIARVGSQDQANNEEAIAKKETSLKKLRYYVHSIEKRIDEEAFAYGPEQFLDWWHLLEMLNEFKDSKQDLNAAFLISHTCIWNWTSRMWNSKTQRCLVFFICRISAPLAHDCGITELGDQCKGITLGEYR